MEKMLRATTDINSLNLKFRECGIIKDNYQLSIMGHT
jgi:hypothetical protein